MTYYPKSALQTNLYTNGNEYVLDTTKENYIGYYYKTLNNTKFTGRHPKESIEYPDIKLVELTQNVDQPPQGNGFPAGTFDSDDKNIYVTPSDSLYKNETFIQRSIPTSYYPILSNQEKQDISFLRYFCKKNNEYIYLEIDKITFKKLKNQDPQLAYDLYTPVSLLWYIRGESKEKVYTLNKSLVAKSEKRIRWPGFSQYFKDNFTQFYQQPPTQENLYTNGGEFKTPDSKEYVGSYHIHPEKGAMVGAIHTKKKHNLLTPINPTLSTQITSSQPPSTPSINLGGGYSSGGGY